jgi:hypothetical protein
MCSYFFDFQISPGLESLAENLFGNHFRESMNTIMIPSHLYPYTCDGLLFPSCYKEDIENLVETR